MSGPGPYRQSPCYLVTACLKNSGTGQSAHDAFDQNIIIGGPLKYKKQIVINGQDYVHNPENKLTLTMRGAFAESERARIIDARRADGFTACA